MAFSSIGVLSDCDCATTNMTAAKMPHGDYAPEALSFKL